MEDQPSHSPTSGRRSIRSRDGCLTCKRRKVKCDESRPRCAHCERLNMECKWTSSSTASRQRRGISSRSLTAPPKSGLRSTAATTTVEPATTTRHDRLNGPSDPLLAPIDNLNLFGGDNMPASSRYALDQVFDYASFMWNSEDLWAAQAEQQPYPHDMPGGLINDNGLPVQSSSTEPLATDIQTSPVANSTGDRGSMDGSEGGLFLTINPQQPPAENHRLIDYFIHAVTPPILVEIETPKKWFAMRRLLIKMATASKMVRWALLSFSAQLLRRRDGNCMTTEHNTHYENAAAEIVTALNSDLASSPTTLESAAEHISPKLAEHSRQREHILAAIFFLSYVDILEGRNEAAHTHLKRAYQIFQGARNESLATVEKQLLLWLRLLDARVASAGGDGLFLSKDAETLLVQASPATLGGGHGDSSDDDSGQTEVDMEDVLFQVLYQPGIVFFQKVQSFMGRISNIDPWHRPRGTVEDEIEVMNLGKSINTDLATLYDQRPLLMDHAVAGRLTAPYVTAHLAIVVTRAYRTYLSNYYASKIHLHRVAYKSFPLTKEASEAIDKIRQLAKMIAEGLDQEDAMPVSMLWPLLMLGSEEQDHLERSWIKAQILRMEKVAGNARITAQVLEEVQQRQDASHARVDIRSVMHAIFNSSFAIV